MPTEEERIQPSWLDDSFNTEFTESDVGENSPDELVADQRARFGDIGVESVDKVVVLLFDDAALELHGEGKSTAIESKVFRKKSEALDGFVLSEMRGETTHLVLDESVSVGMSRHFRVGGKLQALFREFRRDGNGIDDDESDNKFALIAHDHGI
jgi:hypothetical protein